MVRELINCHRRHQIQVDGCLRRHRQTTIAFINRKLVGGGRIQALAALVPNAGLYTGKKIYAQLLSPTEINLRHCSADHTLQDHLLMDHGADLFISRSTQPRLQQKQQKCPPQPRLLLLLLKCLLKTKIPQAATVAPLPLPPVISLPLTGVPWMTISRLPCLLPVKSVLPGKMLMLIYRLFSMALLEERDCWHALT